MLTIGVGISGCDGGLERGGERVLLKFDMILAALEPVLLKLAPVELEKDELDELEGGSQVGGRGSGVVEGSGSWDVGEVELVVDKAVVQVGSLADVCMVSVLGGPKSLAKPTKEERDVSNDMYGTEEEEMIKEVDESAPEAIPDTAWLRCQKLFAFPVR
ncbi:hypothetical protein GYMLUDRAFT_249968 [Collybiopsis luxurians FD-317 M1]|uniref:Uncharacterized protein n=1 Tax=Collybiopsis luxurians FD-317 M1 TaxID=944289 RepID=A0A0D0ATW5_9AGAR|nr:hypothetical protein GYMLUDRAFT_249968 [Collybiopsis luxurians FD-317 M1]